MFVFRFSSGNEPSAIPQPTTSPAVVPSAPVSPVVSSLPVVPTAKLEKDGDVPMMLVLPNFGTANYLVARPLIPSDDHDDHDDDGADDDDDGHHNVFQMELHI